ncbi:uncharacterized protein BDZ99DRAFT_45469 [Mytilinidion resinicola]|uniref:Uncharacterized protein n=1 Tax=Mytilinidion resinicola TaxID=574789 RepID=A0A6A6YJS0_9PEZI|nr:uncharacterized protein BDZ99DRAFT_45469 [Mytilinidion resinicola]KAF2809102.1 hypothetical protein BDZ99DRAFT_45469 [Mytilinidion resinicola]
MGLPPSKHDYEDEASISPGSFTVFTHRRYTEWSIWLGGAICLQAGARTISLLGLKQSLHRG